MYKQSYGEQVSRRAKERRKLKIAEDSAEFLSGFGRDDRIKPVITLVIYWKAGIWDGPRNLYDMFELVDDRLKEYINDYKLHIIVPDEIDDFEKFETELGLAFEFIANSQKRDGMEAIKQNSKFMEVSYETVNLLNICTNTYIECNNERGVVNVCKGIEDMKDYARQEGRNMEFVNAIERIAKNVGSIKTACDLYGTTVENYHTVIVWQHNRMDVMRKGVVYNHSFVIMLIFLFYNNLRQYLSSSKIFLSNRKNLHAKSNHRSNLLL